MATTPLKAISPLRLRNGKQVLLHTPVHSSSPLSSLGNTPFYNANELQESFNQTLFENHILRQQISVLEEEADNNLTQQINQYSEKLKACELSINKLNLLNSELKLNISKMKKAHEQEISKIKSDFDLCLIQKNDIEDICRLLKHENKNLNEIIEEREFESGFSLINGHNSSFYLSGTDSEQRWLDDNDLNTYRLHLIKRLNLESNGIMFCDPIISKLIKCDLKSSLKHLDALLFTSFKFFLIPVNDSNAESTGKHWSLLFLDVGKKSFHHFDSVAGFNAKHARSLALNLSNYFNFGDFNYEEANAKQQINGVDCGVYLLHNANQLASNLLTFFSPCVSGVHLAPVPVRDIRTFLEERLRFCDSHKDENSSNLNDSLIILPDTPLTTSPFKCFSQKVFFSPSVEPEEKWLNSVSNKECLKKSKSKKEMYVPKKLFHQGQTEHIICSPLNSLPVNDKIEGKSKLPVQSKLDLTTKNMPGKSRLLNEKQRVLVVASSHGRGLQKVLAKLITDVYSVMVIFKPNATFNQVAASVPDLVKDFSFHHDHVIIIGGSNDVPACMADPSLAANFFDTEILKRASTITNVHVMSVLPRFDIEGALSVVKRMNQCLQASVKGLANFIDVSHFTRQAFNRFGLHLHFKSKQMLCSILVHNVYSYEQLICDRNSIDVICGISDRDQYFFQSPGDSRTW